jgi:hypothetical protein
MNVRNFYKPIDNESGMVLLVSLLVILVLILVGTTSIMTTSTDLKISGNYKTGEQALYQANAGVEQVIAYLKSTHTVSYPTTADSPTTLTVTCPTGYAFNTSVVLNYVAANIYKFQMTGTSSNSTRAIEVYIRGALLPGATDGAVAMYGGGPAVQFKTGGGGGYALDGHDYPVPTDPACNGSACDTTADASLPAVPGLFTVMSPTLTGNVTDHLGGDPTQTIGSSREAAYQNLVDTVIANNLYQTTLGTRANPAITLIPNGTTLNASTNGAGIIIVDDGGELRVNGNFCFEGLIILRGSGTVTGAGTGNVYGSLVTIGHAAKLIDLTGSINIFYSSAAIANLSNIDATNIKKTAWRDVY